MRARIEINPGSNRHVGIPTPVTHARTRTPDTTRNEVQHRGTEPRVHRGRRLRRVRVGCKFRMRSRQLPAAACVVVQERCLMGDMQRRW